MAFGLKYSLVAGFQTRTVHIRQTWVWCLKLHVVLNLNFNVCLIFRSDEITHQIRIFISFFWTTLGIGKWYQRTSKFCGITWSGREPPAQGRNANRSNVFVQGLDVIGCQMNSQNFSYGFSDCTLQTTIV